jgi:hypothetical protein
MKATAAKAIMSRNERRDAVDSSPHLSAMVDREFLREMDAERREARRAARLRVRARLLLEGAEAAIASLPAEDEGFDGEPSRAPSLAVKTSKNMASTLLPLAVPTSQSGARGARGATGHAAWGKRAVEVPSRRRGAASAANAETDTEAFNAAAAVTSSCTCGYDWCCAYSALARTSRMGCSHRRQ